MNPLAALDAYLGGYPLTDAAFAAYLAARRDAGASPATLGLTARPAGTDDPKHAFAAPGARTVAEPRPAQPRGSSCFRILPVALWGSSPRKRTSFGTL